MTFDIPAEAGWFSNCDRVFEVVLLNKHGQPLDLSLYTSLRWLCKRRLSDADADAVLSANVAVVDPTGGAVAIQISAVATRGLTGVFFHEVKNTGPGMKAVLASGLAVLRPGVHQSV